MLEAEYRQLLKPFRRGLKRLRLDLEFFLDEVGPVTLIGIALRLKTLKSAANKSQTLNRPIQELHDLAGIRVIGGTKVDVDTLRHFFANGPPGTAFKILLDKKIDRRDGYRAHHMVIETKPDYTATWFPCHVEVQLQTALESAFNKLSRRWRYKSNREVNATWEKGFRSMSRSLKKYDAIASDLQRELFSARASNRDDDRLTPLAYQSIIHEYFNEATDFDDAVWHTVFYSRNNISTCGDLRRFFGRTDIAEFYQECLKATTEHTVLGVALNSKHGFWEMCGTRLQAFRELLANALHKKDDA